MSFGGWTPFYRPHCQKADDSQGSGDYKLKTCKILTIVGIQMGASTISFQTNTITRLLFGGVGHGVEEAVLSLIS